MQYFLLILIVLFNGQLMAMAQEDLFTTPDSLIMSTDDLQEPRTMVDKYKDLGDCCCCMCLSGAIMCSDLLTHFLCPEWSDLARKKIVNSCQRTRSGKAIRDLLEHWLHTQ